LLGERNPQSAAEEFAPPPKGESVLAASMMAELIVTKKEIAAQLKKPTGNFAGQAEKPRRGQSTIAVGGETLSRAFDHLASWFGGVLVAGIAASDRTPVEGKIGADTAARTQVTQG
jgi:hypothetical protein